MSLQSSATANNILYKAAGASSCFEVNVAKEDFKFNAAHFVAYQGFRERLHGHNYRVSVRLIGQQSRKIGADGYVIDFGCVKDVCKKVCKRLNEHFLCPMYSNVLTIKHESNSQITITCHDDGSFFSFPELDCALLPIVHATTEELCIYLWGEILAGLHALYLRQRGIHTLEVTVSEAPGQDATFRHEIPSEQECIRGGSVALDVREFVSTGQIVPMPCTSDTLSACCKDCGKSRQEFAQQLEALTQAINKGKLGNLVTGNGNNGTVTVEDLKTIMHQT